MSMKASLSETEHETASPLQNEGNGFREKGIAGEGEEIPYDVGIAPCQACDVRSRGGISSPTSTTPRRA